MGNDILMDVQHLSHIFRLNRKVEVHAVDDVSFIKKNSIDFSVSFYNYHEPSIYPCL